MQALLTNPLCAPAQPTRRSAASSSSAAPNASRLSAQVATRAAQRGAAGQRGASLRVLATSAPPAAQAGAKAAGGDSGVYDVVVVGAGISGLTTAQVRRRCSRALAGCAALLRACFTCHGFAANRAIWSGGASELLLLHSGVARAPSKGTIAPCKSGSLCWLCSCMPLPCAAAHDWQLSSVLRGNSSTRRLHAAPPPRANMPPPCPPRHTANAGAGDAARQRGTAGAGHRGPGPRGRQHHHSALRCSLLCCAVPCCAVLCPASPCRAMPCRDVLRCASS